MNITEMVSACYVPRSIRSLPRVGFIRKTGCSGCSGRLKSWNNSCVWEPTLELSVVYLVIGPSLLGVALLIEVFYFELLKPSEIAEISIEVITRSQS